MGGIFKSPSKPKLPPVPAPAPMPVEKAEIIGEEETRRAAARRRGWQETILTGDLVPVSAGKKTRLG